MKNKLFHENDEQYRTKYWVSGDEQTKQNNLFVWIGCNIAGVENYHCICLKTKKQNSKNISS